MAMNKIWMLDHPIYFTPPPVRGRYSRLMKGDSAPPPPDPYATANAQKDANVDAARQTAGLSRTDEVSPFGTTKWSQDAANADHWTSTFTLDPQIQGLLDQVYKNANTPAGQVDLNGLSKVAGGQDYRNSAFGTSGNGVNNLGATADGMGGAINNSNANAVNSGALASSQTDRLKQLYAQDFNFDAAPAMPTADQASRKAVEDAYYAKAKARLDPQYQQQEDAMRSRLANQGVTEGSEAYNKELQQFMQGRNDAYSGATNDAVINSTSEMQKLFGMGLAARQQGVSEAEYQRELGTKEAQAAAGMFGTMSGINNANIGTQGNAYQAQSALRDAAQNRGAQAQTMDQSARTNQFNELLQAHGVDMSDKTNLINMLMSLRTGAQVNAPGSGQIQVQAAPVAQSIYNSANLAAQNAATAQSGSNAMLNTAGQLGGAAIMTAF